MKTYRVYRLSALGRILSGHWMEAADEDDARTKAMDMCDDGSPTVEIWQGKTRLAVLQCPRVNG